PQTARSRLASLCHEDRRKRRPVIAGWQATLRQSPEGGEVCDKIAPSLGFLAARLKRLEPIENAAAMQELKKDFPPGVDSTIIYDPTIFIAKSIHEVIVTIFVAILLVVVVVFLFLQSWRATVIPVIAIPVSLVGT